MAAEEQTPEYALPLEMEVGGFLTETSDVRMERESDCLYIELRPDEDGGERWNAACPKRLQPSVLLRSPLTDHRSLTLVYWLVGLIGWIGFVR